MVIQQPAAIITKNKKGDVMVLGGGVSGIQASLDLAADGFKVCLVDDSPAIGGKMAQLDKTFPTCDCSMCILSPKFVEIDRHPNIDLMTYHKVEKVEGEAGNFKVTLTKKPRYVNEDLCVGCGTCARYCAVSIPDVFNLNLSRIKSIAVPFAQAIPGKSVVDHDSCLYFQRKCKSCVPTCKNKAIDFTQKEETVELEVGSIILAAGYQPFDPSLRRDYGYGTIKNVITSMEFERILSAAGPFKGEMRRPSDGKVPHKIAWIQCVGSRQVTPGGNSYCSAACCMYATKQAILAKDHEPALDATIFHNDVRAFGKDFERFYQRAQNLPVHYIRSYVSIGKEIPTSKNVTIRYSTESGVKEDEFELVVLSVGLTPPKQVQELAAKFGVELNQHNFCQTNLNTPVETSRPGIYVSGAFQGPMDIPESVMSGSGAASRCAEQLSARRGQLAEARVYPDERDVTAEPLKIGVFVCHCGTNIASVVDVPSVVRFAATLPGVVHAEENTFSCSADSARKMSVTIKEKGLNRVVVAACTPRTHEPLFQDTLREAGVNKYLFAMANIREHCAWVHSSNRPAATDKAKDTVRMAIAEASRLRPLGEIEVPVTKKGLVIGGGIAGMTSALSLAGQGFEVYLVEKSDRLGGVANRLQSTLEGIDVQAYLKDIIQKVEANPFIRVMTGTSVIEASGYVGNFNTSVQTTAGVKELTHGVTIIATGAGELKPDEYLYGKSDRVVIQLELEEAIAGGDSRITGAKSLVMIQCVGCRDEKRPYCSRVCCGQSVKNALKLKELNPQMDIYIIYRDMMTYSFKENYYRQAADKEVKFIRYDLDNKPVVEAVGDALKVTVFDPILGKNLALDADIVALAAATVPPESNSEISQLFKVPLNQDKFFLEAHVKLRPVDFSADGVYLCGIAHYPKNLTETITQAYGAAGRAVTILARDSIKASGIVAKISKDICNGCGLCVQGCYFDAITYNEKECISEVNPVLCKGCGNCAAICPSGAAQVEGFKDEQILAKLKAII